MAKFGFTLENSAGEPQSGLRIQIKNPGGTVVAETDDSSVTDNGDGSYITASDLASGTYTVFTGAGAGTAVPALTSVAHVDPDDVPGDPVPVANGGTGATTAAGARTALGLEIGTDVQAALSSPIAVAEGGTGASTASGARTALGLQIGVDVQAYDAQLSSLAALSSTEVANLDAISGITYSSVNLFPIMTVSGWIGANVTTMKQALDLEVGVDVQGYSANLGLISALTSTRAAYLAGWGQSMETWVASDDRLCFSSSGGFSYQPPASARATLGLGDAAVADIGTGSGEVAAGDHTHDSDYVALASNTGAIQAPILVDVLPTAGSAYLAQIYVRKSSSSFGVYMCVQNGLSAYKWVILYGAPVSGGAAEALQYDISGGGS